MPRYFFVIQDGIEIDDPVGIEFPDLESALEEARGTARELYAKGIRGGRSRSHWTVSVKNEAGTNVGSVQFDQVARDRDHIGDHRAPTAGAGSQF